MTGFKNLTELWSFLVRENTHQGMGGSRYSFNPHSKEK